MPDLRKQFFEILERIMGKDKKVRFITCDLGYSFFERIQNKFPKQFLNAGCIEQSAVGICAGLAMSGLKPYFYSTTPFAIMRPYEFIRDDVCYQNLNVKLIGTSASGFLGFSHNLEGLENEEDILKNLPNLQIYFPKYEDVLKTAMESSYKLKCPSYIRI